MVFIRYEAHSLDLISTSCGADHCEKRGRVAYGSCEILLVGVVTLG
jgi:hypothetical protein